MLDTYIHAYTQTCMCRRTRAFVSTLNMCAPRPHPSHKHARTRGVIPSHIQQIDCFRSPTGLGDPHATGNCIKILHDMTTGGRNKVVPNAIIYSLVLNAFAQEANKGSESAVDKCLVLLEDMKKTPRSSPDVIAYSTVISVLAKAVEREGGRSSKIETILRLVKDMNLQTNTAANNITYSTIVHALTNLMEKGDDDAFEQYVMMMSSVDPGSTGWITSKVFCGSLFSCYRDVCLNAYNTGSASRQPIPQPSLAYHAKACERRPAVCR